MTEEDKIDIKEINMQILDRKGYRYTSWLPVLEDPNLRSLDEVKGRMGILLALINISFDIPIEEVRNWVLDHDLAKHLSKKEEALFAKSDAEIDEDERSRLRWYIEGLWALLWATNVIDNLKETEWSEDQMQDMIPSLYDGEDMEKFNVLQSLRSVSEIYCMLDLYYRLHWYCVDERINGREAKINEGLVYERRYALEWLLFKETDWDEIEMST